MERKLKITKPKYSTGRDDLTLEVKANTSLKTLLKVKRVVRPRTYFVY
jgi:hypothetical protein